MLASVAWHANLLANIHLRDFLLASKDHCL